MVDRYALCWGHRDKEFAREFYETVKKNAIFTINLRPEYEDRRPGNEHAYG